MCLLYRLDKATRDIARIFGANSGTDPWAGGYVAPGRFGPVVVSGPEGRAIVPRVWGVPPPPRGDKPLYNIRNLDSPFWSGALRYPAYRCLVPVTSFMEWGGGVSGKRAQHWFAVPSEPVFAFAGLWRDSDVMSFAFLTCDPNPLIGAIHPKSMPVIVAPYDYDRWLTGDWADARGIAEPYPSQLIIELAEPPPG